MSKNILIVGGGIAGLSMMNFLKKTSATVDLIEKDKTLRVTGAGLTLGINAMNVLRELGLENQILEEGQKLNHIFTCASNYKPLLKTDLKRIENETNLPTVVIHRKQLQQTLLSQIDISKIKTNCAIEQISQTDGQYQVHFNDNSTKFYDIIIGADGIHSKLRKEYFPQSTIRPSGQCCWRFISHLPKELPSDTAVEMWAHGKRVGLFPISNKLVYCYLAGFIGIHDHYRTITELSKLFAEFSGPIQEIFSKIDKNIHVNYGPLSDLPDAYLHQGNIAFIGDAGHATTPNMGQGAAMAMESAQSLYQALIDHEFQKSAFESYHKDRYHRVRMIQKQSYRIGNLTQSKNKVYDLLRNTTTRLIPNYLFTNSVKNSLLIK